MEAAIAAMPTSTRHEKVTPTKLQGKFTAMVVCWLLGIGCSFTWNSMLTIEDYYVTLFPKYHPLRILTLVYQPFALVALAILAYHEANMNTRKRNLFGYTLFFVGTLVVLLLDLATSGKGGIGSFIGVCAVSAAFGLADAYVQGGMVGDLSFMLPEFIQSFLAGLAASGALTSGLRMFTKGVFDNSQNGLRKGAHMSFTFLLLHLSFYAGLAASGALTSGLRMFTKGVFDNSQNGLRKGAHMSFTFLLLHLSFYVLFFALCTIFELLCVLLYAFVFPKLPIVKYYRSKAASEGSKTVSADLAAGGIYSNSEKDEADSMKLERLSSKELIMENLDYVMDMFLMYLLTLSIFPGFLSEDTGSHSLGSWYALVLIAMYNVWDLVGRNIPLIKCMKLESRMGLMIAVLARFLLIPAFYFTAKYAGQGWMIFLTSFLGLSSGYLTVCVLTSAPKGYKGPEQNALGNILVLYQLGGVFAGVMSDWLWLIGKGW